MKLEVGKCVLGKREVSQGMKTSGEMCGWGNRADSLGMKSKVKKCVNGILMPLLALVQLQQRDAGLHTRTKQSLVVIMG